MKTVVFLLFLAVVALLSGLELASFGLGIVAFVLVLGDLSQLGQSETACTHDCQQGDACTCRAAPTKADT